jgi:O-antigen ligase
MFEDHPIFGVGYQKNGPPRVLDYYEQMGISRDAFASHAHNVYLNFLSGTGIGGLFLYLGFTLSIAWIGLQNIRKLNAGRSWLFFFAVAALSAQAIFMLGGFTEYNFGDSEVRYQFLTHLSFQLFIRRKIS